MEKQTPRKTFRAGSVRASIWDNEVRLSNGETVNMPRACVERRYRHAEGEWISSNYFNVNELAKLQAVIRTAFDYLVLQEREPNASRSSDPLLAQRSGLHDDEE